MPIESRHRLLTTIGWGIGGRITYCLEGSVFIGGAVVQWLRDGLGVIANSAEVETLAAQVTDSDDVYFVPAFVGMGAPYWDPYAAGRSTALPAELPRPTSPGGAGVDDLSNPRRVGGDAEGRQHWAGRFEGRWRGFGQPSLDAVPGRCPGRTVCRPEVAETTALGAAYLAGLAVGYWQDFEELTRNWAVECEYLPRMAAAERDAKYARWRKAVERSLRWAE